MTAPSARRVATLVVVPPALLRSHHSPPPHALPKVDPESMTFLAAADSPTGYAGVMFAGAWSGTLSLYEFKKAPRAIPPRLATCPLTLTLPTCTPTSGGRQQVQHLPRGVHPRPQLPGDPGPARTSLRLDRDLPGGLRRCVRRNVPQGALVKSALCSTRSPTRRVIERCWRGVMTDVSSHTTCQLYGRITVTMNVLTTRKTEKERQGPTTVYTLCRRAPPHLDLPADERR